jgi:hypothetical protein
MGNAKSHFRGLRPFDIKRRGLSVSNRIHGDSMNNSEEETLIGLFDKLAEQIKDIIENGKSKGIFKPGGEEFFQWKITEFEYNENGIAKSSGKGEHIVEESWTHLYHSILEEIKTTNEYLSAINLINKHYGRGDNLEYPFSNLLTGLISRIFSDSKSYKSFAEKLILTFIKDLKGEPLRQGAIIKLNGIVILSQPIKFKIGDIEYILRQTTKQDLEKKVPAYLYMGVPDIERPPAFLSIEFLGRLTKEVQTKVEQSIALLRLYSVGSVRYISYRMYSETLLNLMASSEIRGNKTHSTLEKYVIYDDNAEKIKNYWQIMINKVPKNFYEFGEKKLDHVAISYSRYSDALLLNGIKERRISNAVMGLESLYLKGGEKAELTYRLKIRVAKILSLFEYDPYKIKKVIRDAYKIRSSFVHGGHLSYDTNCKINDRYGDIDNFLNLLLDYLRVSIIIWVFIKKGKDEILDLIDDSFIDKNKEEQLKKIISPSKNVIG